MIQADIDKLTAAGAGAFAVKLDGTVTLAAAPKAAIGYGRRVEVDKTVTLQAFCADGSVIETK